MEIGVANGENARTMVMVAIQNFPAEEVEYYGFDTFGANDNSHMKWVRTKLEKTGCQFRLFKGDSVKTLPKVLKILPKMDLIFIDGGHSYPTVKSDWEKLRNPPTQQNSSLLPQLRFLRTQKSCRQHFPRRIYGEDIATSVRLPDSPRQEENLKQKRKGCARSTSNGERA